MLRLLRAVSREMSPDDPVWPVMAYVCECGTRWTNSTTPTWECDCGRQLVKRNDVIHLAIGPTSRRMAGGPRIFSVAAG